MLINDIVVEQEDAIANHVLQYYENLYQAGVCTQNNLIEEVIPSLVTNDQNYF